MTLKILSKHLFFRSLNWLNCMILRTEGMDVTVTCFSAKTNLIYIEDTRTLFFFLNFLQIIECRPPHELNE